MQMTLRAGAKTNQLESALAAGKAVVLAGREVAGWGALNPHHVVKIGECLAD